MRHSQQTVYRTKVKENNEELVIDFQDFNGVFLAKISNSNDKNTHAYGSTVSIAQQNAIQNYQTKYKFRYGILS
jgi:hypothetical protein